MNPIKRVKSKGISLRVAHIIMIMMTFIVMCILLFYTFQSSGLYAKLADTTDSYIELQKSAESLMDASDYLTDKVQRFTVIFDEADMNAYFDEAHNARRRENAVDEMEHNASDKMAFEVLSLALKYSVELMDTEYQAMKLICDACGYTPAFDEVKNAVLPDECAGMNKDEKIRLAQSMVHGGNYYEQKTNIRTSMEECIKTLIDDTQRVQTEINAKLRINMIVMQTLLIVQAVGIIIMFWLTSYLGINPILKAVRRIRENRKMPVTGSYEFRYLAKTYNKMYEAVQKSIENLNYEASHDKLTDLYNRAGYELISESIDLGSTAILIVDADQFKEINDTNGHQTGDAILKKIADALKYTFRREDYICRIGGDEFVVFMLHMDEKRKELINIKINHINDVLADTSDGLPETSVSVGVSFGSSEESLESAIKHADEALYDMKAAGKHGCAFYENDKNESN